MGDDMRNLIAKLTKAQPEKSDRQIAETAKVSPTTVGTVRTEMEAAGDVHGFGSQVKAVKVAADHEGDGVGFGALEVLGPHFDASLATGAIPIAAVENFALVEVDFHSLAQTVLANVGDQRIEIHAFHQREHVGQRVEVVLLDGGNAGGLIQVGHQKGQERSQAAGQENRQGKGKVGRECRRPQTLEGVVNMPDIMNRGDTAPARSEVDAFLADLKKKTASVRGRLIFALDATCVFIPALEKIALPTSPSRRRPLMATQTTSILPGGCLRTYKRRERPGKQACWKTCPPIVRCLLPANLGADRG
jgi:hypothetical protein